MFCVTNIRKISRSETRTHHTSDTSQTLQEGSCNRNSKIYFSDVTFNSFFFWFSKSTENLNRPVKLSVKIQQRTTTEQLFLRWDPDAVKRVEFDRTSLSILPSWKERSDRLRLVSRHQSPLLLRRMHRTTYDMTNAGFANRARSWWYFW